MGRRLCYGCTHIRSQFLGDGSTTYGCADAPGLITGCTGAFDDDEPYEASADGCWQAAAKDPG